MKTPAPLSAHFPAPLPAALVVALLAGNAAIADPVAPWLKVEVLAPSATQVPMFPDMASYIQFGEAGPVCWTNFSEYPSHGTTWFQPEGTLDVLPVTVPVRWNAALGPALLTQVVSVTEEGAAFGQCADYAQSLGTAWVQDATYPFEVHALGLTEPRNVGPNGEYASGVSGRYPQSRFALGSNRVYQPLQPGDPTSELWLWEKGSPQVRPLPIVEDGRPLTMPYPYMQGNWVYGYAIRRSNMGVLALMVNAETGEQRRLGYTDADHTMEVEDYSYPQGIMPAGYQHSTIMAVDPAGYALGSSRRQVPDFEGGGADAWLYSWQDGSYTPVALPQTYPVFEINVLPDRSSYIFAYSDRDPAFRAKLGVWTSAGLQREIELPPLWPSWGTIIEPHLISVRWNGDEPVVVFGYERTYATEVRWNMHRVFVWKPSTGTVEVKLGDGPIVGGYTRLTSLSGRRLLLGASGYVMGTPGTYGYGLLDVQTGADTGLPSSPRSGQQALSASFAGEDVLMIFPVSAEGAAGTGQEALVVGADGASVDVSAYLTVALNGAGVSRVTVQQRTQGKRVLLAAVDESGNPARVYITPIDRCSNADIASAGAAEGPDHALDNNDFIRFIDWFFTADLRADLGVAGGFAGTDGLLDNNDFIAFINAFFAGCP